MDKQEFLREHDFSVTLTPVNADEIMSRVPWRTTRRYERATELQKTFVDYTINLVRRSAMGKVEKGAQLTDEIDVMFPLIFPENADVLPSTLEYIKSMNLELLEKCINGERATYILKGKIKSEG